MNFSYATLFAGVAALLVMMSGTQATTGKQTQQTDSQEEQIAAILVAQAKSWNDGDLETFMQTYWKSEELTFSSGGETTRGWQATLDRYRKSYAPPQEMGHLDFDQLETTLIEDSAALVLGRWQLTMKDKSSVKGNFSLVLRKIDDQWKIIHDHSSELKPTDAKRGTPKE